MAAMQLPTERIFSEVTAQPEGDDANRNFRGAE
jgi:hypothetical protein